MWVALSVRYVGAAVKDTRTEPAGGHLFPQLSAPHGLTVRLSGLMSGTDDQEKPMPAGPEPPPLNPFAAELRRAAAGVAAPDKAPSLRELSSVSGVGRSAIGDWLTGKSLPRSWDDGAVLVVEAIIKLAARYGKRFADEQAVRQRFKDAYARAKNAQQVDSHSDNGTPVPSVDATAAAPAEAAPRCTTNDEPEPTEPGLETSSTSIRWWRAKYGVAAVAVFAVLTVAVALTLLPHQDAEHCLHKTSITPWGAGDIHVCPGQGSYFGSTNTTDKTPDGYCVWWRITWKNKTETHTPEVCEKPKGIISFNPDAPDGVSGAWNAFLELCHWETRGCPDRGGAG